MRSALPLASGGARPGIRFFGRPQVVPELTGEHAPPDRALMSDRTAWESVGSSAQWTWHDDARHPRRDREPQRDGDLLVTRTGDVLVRTTSQAVIIVIAGVLGAVSVATVALSPTPSGSSHHASEASRLVGFALAAVLLASAIRLARSAAIIRSDALLIRNPVRTICLPWSMIAGFRIGRHGLWPRVCIVSCNDGSEVAIWAIQGVGPLVARPGRGSVVGLLAKLDDALRDTQRTAPPKGPD